MAVAYLTLISKNFFLFILFDLKGNYDFGYVIGDEQRDFFFPAKGMHIRFR